MIDSEDPSRTMISWSTWPSTSEVDAMLYPHYFLFCCHLLIYIYIRCLHLQCMQNRRLKGPVMWGRQYSRRCDMRRATERVARAVSTVMQKRLVSILFLRSRKDCLVFVLFLKSKRDWFSFYSYSLNLREISRRCNQRLRRQAISLFLISSIFPRRRRAEAMNSVAKDHLP